MGDGPDPTLVAGRPQDRGRPRGHTSYAGATIEVSSPDLEEHTITQLAAPAPPRLYRAADGRVVAGVAQGLATHLSVPPTRVRIGFALLAFFSGFGILLYLALWAVVPQQPLAPDAPPRPRRAVERGTAVALAVLVAGGLVALRDTFLFGANPLLVPLLLGSAGLAVMWRQADASQRERWRRISGFERVTPETKRSRWAAITQIAGGAVLVVAGVGSFLLVSGTLSAARDGLVAAVAVLAGLALLTAPLWWRLVADLAEERRERIRSQERADLAAHLHDSVLQTLALIQRHADEPREVARLARGQERELRTWLYRPEDRQQSRFAAALESVAGEVEDAYVVQVESVVVGDAEVDDRLGAVVQATREALVNAAKHAGVSTVSLYAEVELEEVTVFVRDRGTGFDPDVVAADRHGVQGSIMGRMERHGGKAAVRSRPGAGTEVELTMTLAATRNGT
jgi:signal transduction histidine kinase/phage shock protein PspC (stress-responsive transcriptional regulator)